MQLEIFLLIISLALIHAAEPDHIVTLRMVRGIRKYIIFGVSHGVGFAIIAIPLILLFSYSYLLELAGDILGIGFAIVLLTSELLNKEIEIAPRGSGIAQGALAITPSKILVAIIAAQAGLILGLLYIILFIVISSSALILVGITVNRVPKNISKVFNIIISFVTIIYLLIQIFNI